MRFTEGLARWGNDPGGWTMVETDADIRIEGAMGLGHIPTRGEAVRQATAELTRFQEGQLELALGIDPDGTGDVPFTDFGIGDLVTVDGDDYRTIAFTVGQDSERPGRVVYVPQVGDVIDPPTARLQRATKKMSNGTLGGSSRIASPLSMFSRLPAAATEQGGGAPYATVLVAAPNSQHPNAAQADFVGDYSAIASAINSMDADQGGLVLLLDGLFEFPSGAYVEVALRDNVTVAGMGTSTQLLGESGSGPAFIFDTCYRPRVRDLLIGGTISDGIQFMSCETPMVTHCDIGNSLGDLTAYGVLIESSSHPMILGNKFWGCDEGIWSDADLALLVQGNVFEQMITRCIDVGDSTDLKHLIDGNILGNATTLIRVRDGGDDISITNNLLINATNGISVGTGCDRILAANNTMRTVTNYFVGAGAANKGAGNYLDGTWTP